MPSGGSLSSDFRSDCRRKREMRAEVVAAEADEEEAEDEERARAEEEEEDKEEGALLDAETAVALG
jgi:hypothetical protein